MRSSLLNVLRLFYGPECGSVLVNVPCEVEKNVYSVSVEVVYRCRLAIFLNQLIN